MPEDMEDREGAGAQVTSYLDLSAWPEGTRASCRREEPHVGAQFNLLDPDGWRHQVVTHNSTGVDIVYLEARHRGHARGECRGPHQRSEGPRTVALRLPRLRRQRSLVAAVGIAADLQAWARTLCLTGELGSYEPERLRYARLARCGPPGPNRRRLTLRLDAAWPCATELQAAFERLRPLGFTT